MGYIEYVSEALDGILAACAGGHAVVEPVKMTGLFPPQFLRENETAYAFRHFCLWEALPDLYEPDFAKFHEWLERCGLRYARGEAGQFIITAKGE